MARGLLAGAAVLTLGGTLASACIYPDRDITLLEEGTTWCVALDGVEGENDAGNMITIDDVQTCICYEDEQHIAIDDVQVGARSPTDTTYVAARQLMEA